MVGYILDDIYPNELITLSHTDIVSGATTIIHPTYMLSMGVLGAFAGVIFGYKLAYDLSIKKYMEREFEITKRAIMAELLDELEKK